MGMACLVDEVVVILPHLAHAGLAQGAGDACNKTEKGSRLA